MKIYLKFYVLCTDVVRLLRWLI